jgi:hypothetical protein
MVLLAERTFALEMLRAMMLFRRKNLVSLVEELSFAIENDADNPNHLEGGSDLDFIDVPTVAFSLASPLDVRLDRRVTAGS